MSVEIRRMRAPGKIRVQVDVQPREAWQQSARISPFDSEKIIDALDREVTLIMQRLGLEGQAAVELSLTLADGLASNQPILIAVEDVWCPIAVEVWRQAWSYAAEIELEAIASDFDAIALTRGFGHTPSTPASSSHWSVEVHWLVSRLCYLAPAYLKSIFVRSSHTLSSPARIGGSV